MGRIGLPEIGRYPWYVRLIFWAQKKKYGKTLAPAFVWGRVPALMLGLQLFYRFLDRKNCLIEKQLKALVSLRISQMNECDFCFSLAKSTLESLRIPEEKVKALKDYASDPRYSEAERAALAYAEKMSGTGAKVPDEVFAELKKEFSEEEIVELTSWIAFQNMSSRFNSALQVDSQEFCVKP